MSKSNASAKNRRAFGGNPPPPSPSSSNPSMSQTNSSSGGQQSGFSLQQVIAVIDNRLINLEKFMKDSNDKHVRFEQQTASGSNTQSQSRSGELDNNIRDILDEYNNRFELLVEEITTLKDVVMKLQSYTMDINKTLLEERIQILSDLGTNTNSIDNQVFNISTEATDLQSNTISESGLEKFNITTEINEA
jgi:hypothetical protein